MPRIGPTRQPAPVPGRTAIESGQRSDARMDPPDRSPERSRGRRAVTHGRTNAGRPGPGMSTLRRRWHRRWWQHRCGRSGARQGLRMRHEGTPTPGGAQLLSAISWPSTTDGARLPVRAGCGASVAVAPVRVVQSVKRAVVVDQAEAGGWGSGGVVESVGDGESPFLLRLGRQGRDVDGSCVGRRLSPGGGPSARGRRGPLP